MSGQPSSRLQSARICYCLCEQELHCTLARLRSTVWVYKRQHSKRELDKISNGASCAVIRLLATSSVSRFAVVMEYKLPGVQKVRLEQKERAKVHDNLFSKNASSQCLNAPLSTSIKGFYAFPVWNLGSDFCVNNLFTNITISQLTGRFLAIRIRISAMVPRRILSSQPPHFSVSRMNKVQPSK